MSQTLLTQEDKLSIAARGYADPVYFCRTFLSEWFTLPMPWFHRGLLAILLNQSDFLLTFGEEHWEQGVCNWDMAGLRKIIQHFTWKERPEDPTCPEQPVFQLRPTKENKQVLDILTTDRTLLMIPRGFAKTTLVNASNIILIVYKIEKFILYISETAPHAEMQLQNVKNQLADNEKLSHVFGNIAPARNDALKWRDDYIETTTGVVVAARGRGGQIRGLIRNGQRPGIIICDDLEDEESVKTPEQRKKARKWLLGTVLPAMRKIGRAGKLRILGTALHADALLMNLKSDPSFMSIIFGAIDKDGEALWAANMTLEKLEAEKLTFSRNGELASYYLEYFNLVKTDATALYTSSMFRYQIMTRSEFVGVALTCDPAISDSATADDCTFAVVGITEKGLTHVLECYGKRGMLPSEQIDKFFELSLYWNPTHRGIEANAYQRALIHSIKTAMFEKSKIHGGAAFFDITPITNKTAKALRIKGVLAPRYRSGYMTHQRRFPELESQLIDYPGKHDDYPDVVAMAVAMLDPFAAFSGDETLLIESSYKDLEFEIGDWRDAP